MAEAAKIAVVIGRNFARLRAATGMTREQFAGYARDFGLRWTASKVADFERGRREVYLTTFLAAGWALSHALADAAARGAEVGAPLQLADLLESDGNVTLVGAFPRPLASVVAAVCRGEPWPVLPEDALGPDEAAAERAHDRMVSTTAGDIRRGAERNPWVKTILDGWPDNGAPFPITFGRDAEDSMLRRSGLAEDRAATALGVSREQLSELSFLLWHGRTFSEERDRRAGADANPQKRGRVARELRAELAEALAEPPAEPQG